VHRPLYPRAGSRASLSEDEDPLDRARVTLAGQVIVPEGEETGDAGWERSVWILNPIYESASLPSTWFGYTDWDAWATKVSGSAALIADLIADDELETIRARRDRLDSRVD
jgi:hypothetical protein